MKNFTNYFFTLKNTLFGRACYSILLFALFFALSSHAIEREKRVEMNDEVDIVSASLSFIEDGSGFATYCEGETNRPVLWRCAAPDDPNSTLTNGGTYSNLPTGAVANGNRVDISGVAPGTYSGIVYTDNDAANSTGTLELTIVTAPNAGDQMMALVVCPDNGVITLADELQGEDIGGSWSAAPNPTGGTFNAVMGTFNPSGASVGSYFFFYDVAPTVTGGTCEDRGVVEVIVGPVVDAFAIQASCDDTDMPNDDAFVQLSSVVGGDRVLVSTANGSVVGDYSSAQDISAATFPLIILDNIPNPTTDETYTVRVFSGSDACFTDVTVTLSPQTCTFSCDCEEYIYLNDVELSLVHKFQTNVDGMGAVQEVFRDDVMGRAWLSQLDIPILDSPHGLGVDQNGNFFIGDLTMGSPIYWVKPDGTLLLDATDNMGNFDPTESFLGGRNNTVSPNGGEAPRFILHIYSDDQNRLYIQTGAGRNNDDPATAPEVSVYDICTALDIYDNDPNTIANMSEARLGEINRDELAWGFHVNGTNLWGATTSNLIACGTGVAGQNSPISLAQSDDLLTYDDGTDATGTGIFEPFPIDQTACKPDGMGGTQEYFSKGVHQAGDFLYVVYSTTGGLGATNNANGIPTAGGSYIAKYQLNFDANGLPISGTLVAESAADNNPSDGGWFGARGIAVDEDGFIYVGVRDGGFPMGMSMPGFTCLVVFEDDGNGNLTEAPGTRVSVPVGVNSESKGLSIAKSCCPESSRASFEITLCADDENPQEKFFLSNLISECAGGRIAEGEWEQEQGFSGVIYDDCDNSVTLSTNDGSGCAVFTLSSDGTAAAAQCDAFVITFSVCVTEPPSMVSIGLDCDQSPAMIDLEATSNSVSGTLQYSWEGPNGFTSTDEDPTLPEGTAGEGDYSVTITDSDGCTTIAMVTANRDNCDVLPVELITFDAIAMQNYIQLDWATASELNNDYFDVERSEDGKSFKTIGQVKGSGTTILTTNYYYEDRTVEEEVVYYYRLKQVDIDGTFEYSDIASARIREAKGEMLVYPNPVGDKDELSIELFASQSNTFVQLIGMQGQLIRTYQIDQVGGWINTTLDISDLESGTYFLKSSDGQVKRFVKMK